jgi:hypothetical protein
MQCTLEELFKGCTKKFRIAGSVRGSRKKEKITRGSTFFFRVSGSVRGSRVSGGVREM